MKAKIKVIAFALIIATSFSSSVIGQTLGGGRTVDCYSQSRDAEDFDYYDCGTCEKVEGRMAFGNARQCSV